MIFERRYFMINKNEFAKVNIKVLIILIIVTAAIGTSLFTARHVRRRFLSKMDLDAGQAAFEKQDWPTASRKLRGYLSRNPDDVEILKKYAGASLYIRPLNVDAISGAIGAYRRVIQLNPLDETAYEKLAMLYAGIGNFEELAYIARTRISHVLDDRKAPLWLAEALFRLHKTDEAEQVLSDLLMNLEKLSDKHPEYVQACALTSAIILFDNPVNAKTQALEMLNRAVNYSPESVEALVNRARFYREAPDVSDMSRQLARKDLETADALGGENPRIHLSLGVEWLAHGELDRAAAKLRFIESLPPETLEKYFFDIDDWTVTKYLFASQLAVYNKTAAEGVLLSDKVLTELQEKGQRFRVLPTAIGFYVAAGKAAEARQYLDEYIGILQSHKTLAESTVVLPYLQAQVAKAEGRLYAVIDALYQAVVSNPSRPELWRLLAEAYSRTDQSRRAINALIQYLRFYPRDPEMTMQLAKEYLKLRDWNRAFETARLAEPMDPTDIIVRLLRIEASIYIAAEHTYTVNTARLEALSVELAELRKENPDRVDIRILQAVIAEYLEKPQEAEAELKLAIEECTEPLRAEMQLVRHYSRAKKMAEAIGVCQAACERHSEVAEPWLSLSSLYAANANYDTARSCIRQGLNSATDQWENRSLSMRLAMLEVLYADRAAGINILKEIASQDEQEIRARLLLLDIREIREDPATAEKLVTELRKAEGENGLYWRLHQASLWLSSENWRSKQPDITDALQYCIDSDPEWSLPVLLLVRMYEKLEDFASFEDTCRQALIRNPSATDVADTLVTLLEKQGRLSEAEQVLQQIEADPRVASAWNVRIALRAGDFSRAIDELKLRVSNDQRDANSRILLARLIYWQNRENANQAFEYLKEAETITPATMALIAAKVSILRSENKAQQARQILEDYVASSNTFSAYSMRAAYFAREGELERAEEDYRKLTTFAGQEVTGYELLSNFYALNQKLDKAIVTLEEGLNAHPEDIRLKRRLMKTLLQQGQPEGRQRAFEILATLEEQLPQDPELMKLRAMQMLELPTPESLKTAREKLEHAARLEPTAVDAHLALINIAMRSGEYEAARDYAIRALGSNSNNLELILARGRAELAIGNTQMATQMANLALQKEPTNTGALGVLLNAALSIRNEDRGPMENAIKSARLMLEEDPNHIEVRDIIVTAALGSNDRTLLEEARTMIESALAKEPADEKLLLSRTRVLVSMNLPQLAVPELEAYIQTKEGSGSIPAIVTLADLYRLNGDLDRAQERIKQAELIDPNAQLVIHAKLLLLIAQNRFDEIENISSAYLSAKEQNPSTLVAAASILASMDSIALKQEGLKLFEQAVSLSPSLLIARLGLASTLYQTGDTQRAKQAYQKVLDEYPNNIQALNDLAWIIQEHEQRYDVALELANRGLRVSREEKDRLHLLDTRGTILSNMPDRLADAMTDFKTLVDALPSDTQQKVKALVKLGRICVKLDDLVQAKQHMQNALEIDKKINALTPDERSEVERILQESGIQAVNR
jgi:tetratricopeptide (TPR) repeat protein